MLLLVIVWSEKIELGLVIILYLFAISFYVVDLCVTVGEMSYKVLTVRSV